MSRRSRIALGVLAAFVVLVGVVASVGYFRAGDIVARRAERMAHDRYDVAMRVGEAHVGTRGIRLTNVELRFPEVDRSVVRIAAIDIAGSPLAIAARRLAAVERIDVHGGELRAVLDDALLEAIVARRARESTTTSNASAAAVARPPLHIDSIAVELLDDQGMLVRALDASADVDGDRAMLRSHVIELGDERGDRIHLDDATANLRRDGRWRIKTFDADNGDARWELALDSLDQASEARLVRRLRDAALRVRHALATSDAEPAAASESRLDRLTTRDAAFHLARASVATGAGDDAKRIGLLDVGVRRLDASRFRLVGQGTGHAGIEARWNLELDPEALRAEGTVRVTRLPLALVGPLIPDIPWEPTMPGLVSLDVEFHAHGLEEVTFRGAIEVEGAALDSRRISAEPIRDLAVRIEGEGTLRPLEHHIVLGAARITTGGVSLLWQGRAELGRGHYVLRGSLVMPRTSCDRAVHAIPADVLGPLMGFRLSGQIGGRMDIDLDRDDLDRTRLDFEVNDECIFDEAPPEADLMRFEAPFHHEVLEPDGTVFSMETGPETPNWVSYGSISPYVVDAVVSHEDGAFFRHRGFAPWAIRDAVVRNLREGRYVVGASTITMQLAKNVFLHREKTLIRKVQEVILTWWLERSLDKQRIMELYLNVIEYGPGVYGLRNAARYYFGCSPSAITPVGAAFLAIILPAPKHYGVPSSGTFGETMRARVGHFLEHMAGQGRLDPETLALAMQELASFRFRNGGGSTVTSPTGDEDRSDGTNSMDWVPTP